MAPLGGLAKNLNGGLKKKFLSKSIYPVTLVYGFSRAETGFSEGNETIEAKTGDDREGG